VPAQWPPLSTMPPALVLGRRPRLVSLAERGARRRWSVVLTRRWCRSSLRDRAQQPASSSEPGGDGGGAWRPRAPRGALPLLAAAAGRRSPPFSRRLAMESMLTCSFTLCAWRPAIGINSAGYFFAASKIYGLMITHSNQFRHAIHRQNSRGDNVLLLQVRHIYCHSARSACRHRT